LCETINFGGRSIPRGPRRVIHLRQLERMLGESLVWDEDEAKAN
jgi:hypothetical protein